MAADLRRSSNISISTSSSRSFMPASASAASSPIFGTSPTSTAPTPANASASATFSPSSPPSHLAIRPPVINTAGCSQSGEPFNKMAMAAVISPATDQSPPPKLPVSMTSKEWVVPPRPKPGRKPATDTPPTKRKAQNRAAQRAFRERRAARIGELEDQLEDQRGDHEREEHRLLDKIEALQKEANTLQGRCQMLEGLLESERRAREELGTELEDYRSRRRNDAHHLHSSSTSRSHLAAVSGQHQSDARALPGFPAYHSASSTSVQQDVRQNLATSPRQNMGLRPVVHALPISQIISPPDEAETADLSCGACEPDGACACADAAMASAVMGCGKCALGSRCGCLDAEINATGGGSGTDLKRPLRSPALSAIGPDEKRQRSDALETDSTATYAHRKRSPSDRASIHNIPPVPQQPPLPPPQLQNVPDKDGCGFCEQGTYCVCADAAMTLAPTATTTMAMAPSSILSQQNQMTPPPSESDVGPMAVEVIADGAVKLPFAHGAARQAGPNGTTLGASSSTKCAAPAGPGTCAQCIADPKSGLFCRSLAANFARTSRSAGNTASPGGCCGNAGPGGCCKSASGGQGGSSARTNVTLSCADTYKTLASHRHFDEATDDIGTWLPLLKAAPGERSGAAGAGLGDHGGAERLPIEVEAASIMGVLKNFDVRFGK